jgi:hypothetical protein
MLIHEVKCDYCGAKAKLCWNGEHFLTPKGWGQIYDDNEAQVLDQHICPKCCPKPKKEVKSESKSK